jgi:hypothetical protein
VVKPPPAKAKEPGLILGVAMAGDTSTAVPVLLITGPLGVGKSAVADEIFERFCAANVPIALIDLDHLGSCWPASGRWDRGLAYRNLTHVWRNYAEVGARRAIIARTIDSRDELRRFEDAIPGAQIVVCRLRARVSTLEARLRLRVSRARMSSRMLPMRSGWRWTSRTSGWRTSSWIPTSRPWPQWRLKSWTARAGLGRERFREAIRPGPSHSLSR